MARSIILAAALGAMLAPAGLAHAQEEWRTTENPLHRVLDVVLTEDSLGFEADGVHRDSPAPSPPPSAIQTSPSLAPNQLALPKPRLLRERPRRE